MATNQYPEFVEGQTLTAHELNQAIEHARYQDTLVGSTVGFGVNAGLVGTFTGSTLQISPGLAIDQLGQVLAHTGTKEITFPPTVATTVYPFIDNGPPTIGGYSVVLEASNAVTANTPCSDTECDGHGKIHTTGVTFTVVPGRVKNPFNTFSGESLLDIDPLLLSVTSQPVGSFAAIRDAVAARIKLSSDPLPIRSTLLTVLETSSIATGDVAGVKAYKAGWINLVLFATIDLLRCRALIRSVRERPGVGVVLGWARQVSGTWVFDCSFRHAWEPPRGYVEAFLGGTCEQPCKLYADELEGLLAGYSPPEPPATPPSTGTPPRPIKCPRGFELVGDKCVKFRPPPLKFPDKYARVRDVIDRLGPVWNPPYKIVANIDDVYGEDTLGRLDDGALGVSGLLGYKVDDVVDTLTNVLEEDNYTPNIRTATPDQLKTIGGYEPALSFSPSDQLVVTIGANNAAVGFGRVSSQHFERDLGTKVPAIEATAKRAEGAVMEFSAFKKNASDKLDVMDKELKGLGGTIDGLRTDLMVLKGSPADQALLVHRVGVLEQQSAQLGAQAERISRLEGKSLAQVGDFGVKTYTTDVGNSIAEFAQTALQAMKTIEQPRSGNFKEQIAAVERSQATLELAVRAGDPSTVADATVGLLDTMRTMIGGAGVEAGAKRKLDAQFRAMQELLG